MKILVCEDDNLLLKALEFRLKKDGFEVLTAEDGKKAIEIIDAQKLDCIISDIMMPYIKGLELLSYVRQKFSEKKIPFIILSGINNEATKIESFELGADDYIVKPFIPSELSFRIKKMLK
ncbi:MAG: hypothetical protein A2X12_10005 [Bacteroidetes bacterium GWE2_29_8]|nr:MAG: hypothetical protein A2X12_10005 [Bacteroidetes bacterium GWE2_29_8]OFY20035.1 MAG: hypothetical protein A2X02_06630 [Bacteroidetes bacterium GWF2_29_10]